MLLGSVMLLWGSSASAMLVGGGSAAAVMLLGGSNAAVMHVEWGWGSDDDPSKQPRSCYCWVKAATSLLLGEDCFK